MAGLPTSKPSEGAVTVPRFPRKKSLGHSSMVSFRISFRTFNIFQPSESRLISNVSLGFGKGFLLLWLGVSGCFPHVFCPKIKIAAQPVLFRGAVLPGMPRSIREV